MTNTTGSNYDRGGMTTTTTARTAPSGSGYHGGRTTITALLAASEASTLDAYDGKYTRWWRVGED
jgi:hypothetical protein